MRKEKYERYAVYWIPPQASELARFGRDWLGSDVESGALCPGPRTAYGLDSALAERATASPRRYGLHATLKAPMRLREGRTPEELAAAMAAFAARRRRFLAGSLRLTRLTRYLALVPQAPAADLEWLAQECETGFDGFRAPLDEAEAARRTWPSMSAQQRELTETFGYPFVLGYFTFHITLAGPLPPDELDRVEALLAPAVAPLCAGPLAIDAIALLGDPGGGAPFRLIGRFPLRT